MAIINHRKPKIRTMDSLFLGNGKSESHEHSKNSQIRKRTHNPNKKKNQKDNEPVLFTCASIQIGAASPSIFAANGRPFIDFPQTGKVNQRSRRSDRGHYTTLSGDGSFPDEKNILFSAIMGCSICALRRINVPWILSLCEQIWECIRSNF